jgi:CheY-like chemotaxis protein
MSEYSIMIIDDNETDRYLLKRRLKQTGMDLTVFEKSDGAEAITFLEDYVTNREQYPDDFPPMLIFLDINMPIMDGWGFLNAFETLRSHLKIESTVVVMFTSSDQTEDRDKAGQYDFVADYYVKGSYAADDLKKTLLDVKQRSDSLRSQEA